MTRDQKALITKISKKYGATIDLNTHPEVLIDILRAFGRIFEDDGGAPGGVGPPGCIVEGAGVTADDLMKAILKLTREVAAIKSAIAATGR
jgi:hypothetical protein